MGARRRVYDLLFDRAWNRTAARLQRGGRQRRAHSADDRPGRQHRGGAVAGRQAVSLSAIGSIPRARRVGRPDRCAWGAAEVDGRAAGLAPRLSLADSRRSSPSPARSTESRSRHNCSYRPDSTRRANIQRSSTRTRRRSIRRSISGPARKRTTSPGTASTSGWPKRVTSC